MGPKKIIIDVDSGMDDAVAIFMAIEAASHSEVDILAITCVQGNSTLENVARNVLRVLKVAKRLDQIPVYKGASSPLVTNVLENPQVYHGRDGFGDCGHWAADEGLEKHVFPTEFASNALIRLANENPGEISLIMLGPLTNLALAMKLDPKFSSKLKEISIMGGNTKAYGNVHIAKEFNFFCDPDAAYVVLENTACPTYILAWEICFEQVSMPYSWRTETIGSIKSPQAEMMNRAEQNVLKGRSLGRWIMCDPVAVAVVLDKKCILQSKQYFATVERHGCLTRGTMLLDHLSHLQKKANIILVTELDVDKIKTRLSWAYGAPR